MNRLFIILLFFFFTDSARGQAKAIKFYSYLQNVIKYKLNSNDSLVLEQYTDECSSCSWVITIFPNKDSCFVNFKPSIFGDSYADLKYSYMVLKDSLIAEIETEKVFLKGNNFKPHYSANLIVSYNNVEKRFKMQYLAGLYYRFRFVKSAIKITQ